MTVGDNIAEGQSILFVILRLEVRRKSTVTERGENLAALIQASLISPVHCDRVQILE